MSIIQFINRGSAPFPLPDAVSWMLRDGNEAATSDVDFVNDRAWKAGLVDIPDLFTCSRGVAGQFDWYEKADGTLIKFANDVLRYGDNGILYEESRTNVVLHNRDLTNAAWTKSNCTAAKDQTGPDGVADSASSLTATAANATCLQAITLASSARFQSARIKRITGTGVISMTMDGGTTWTAVTVTSSWTRVKIPTQTLANPSVGFKIATSGDAIAVDFIQNENGSTGPTSDIETTTAAVTRAKDLVTADASVLGILAAKGTFYCECVCDSLNAFGNFVAFEVSDGSTLNRIIVGELLGGVGNLNASIFDGGATEVNNVVAGPLTVGTPIKAAFAYAENDFAFSADGAAVAIDTNCAMPSSYETLGLGAADAGSRAIPGSTRLKRLAYWPSRRPNALLQSLTA